jgi:small-conductance mechanosensitive channel
MTYVRLTFRNVFSRTVTYSRTRVYGAPDEDVDPPPDLLQRVLLGNSVLDWLIAALIAVLVFAGSRLARWVLVRLLHARAQRIEDRWMAPLAKILPETDFVAHFAVGLWAGARTLDLPPTSRNILGHAVVLSVLVQIGIWGSALVPYLLNSFTGDTPADDRSKGTVSGVLTFVGRFLLWTVLLILALENLGVKVSALVASLGVGGIAVALAAQSLLGDILASLSIVSDRPFVVGDPIQIDDMAGDVERINLRTTHVRSVNGEQLVISNKDILASRISNYGRMHERRGIFAIGVVYRTPFETLRRIPDILGEIIEDQDRARTDRIHFKSYGDSSLEFEIVFWVEAPDRKTFLDVQQEINFEIFRRFEEEGIEFAFPTRTFHRAAPVQPPPDASVAEDVRV